jgi:hypothetical protein
MTKTKITASPVASAIPFDNTGTNFTATDTNSAIIEAKALADGLPRAGIPLTVNGTVGDLNWITYTELLANPRILFPQKVALREFTWVNVNTNIRATDFKFYKNGQAIGNLIFTHTVPAGSRTAGYGYYVWVVDYIFNEGDSLYIQCDYTANGTSLADLALVLWIARVA